jgi:hypothetical protein
VCPDVAIPSLVSKFILANLVSAFKLPLSQQYVLCTLSNMTPLTSQEGQNPEHMA